LDLTIEVRRKKMKAKIIEQSGPSTAAWSKTLIWKDGREETTGNVGSFTSGMMRGDSINFQRYGSWSVEAKELLQKANKERENFSPLGWEVYSEDYKNRNLKKPVFVLLKCGLAFEMGSKEASARVSLGEIVILEGVMTIKEVEKLLNLPREIEMGKNEAAEICRETRSTGRGAFNDSRIYSIRIQEELKPHREEYSRTGNHGEKTWYLLPGTFIEASASISNSGKGGWRVEYLVIDYELKQETRQLQDIPEWLKPLLPIGCLAEVDIQPYE